MVKKEVGDSPIMKGGKLDIRDLDVEAMVAENTDTHANSNGSGGNNSPKTTQKGAEDNDKEDPGNEGKDSPSGGPKAATAVKAAATASSSAVNDASPHVGKLMNNLSAPPSSHHSQVKETGDSNSAANAKQDNLGSVC